MEVVGKIKFLNLNQKISESYQKSEVVVSTDEQYPQHILIEFGGQKSDLLDKYSVGENVKVSINLRGREWVNPNGETRYFNSIQGWRIEKMDAEAPTAAPMPAAPAFAPATNLNEEDDSDLPF
jgi:uncharacterized protein DUF3127